MRPLKRTKFPRIRMRYYLYKDLCEEVQKELMDSDGDDSTSSCHKLTTIANKYNMKRKTLYNWKCKWKLNPAWKPYDTSVHGTFHRIFDDDQEVLLSEFIQSNYIDNDLYFSDKDFQSLCFDTLDQICANNDDERPKFSCSPHFIKDFKDRNRFSSRRAHFKRRPDISDNDPKIQDFIDKTRDLIINARSKGEPVLNGDETQWQILPTNIKTWATKNAKEVKIATTENEKFHVTLMATITSEGDKLPCFMIAHGNNVEDETDQFGEDINPESTSHSAKSYMTTDVFLRYLQFIRNQYTNNETIHLIVDSYSSHTSKFSIAKARDLNIDIVFIPNGMTDELQPLDYGVFSILKSIANAKLRNYMRQNIGSTIGIERSVKFLFDSWEKVSKQTISDAWEKYL